ncbi:anti-sigma B factor antagonist [Geodermatophilus bullaregiensis]|uniref:STAS domain-containing protein n=1 Tax=Geodermatophilus bullaregiensis TaxID=1564160 RepID=UPI0019574267|nr:STAS domain-containing protein [Geodermatophilus bullaregiensis]MBM7808344.1 anti-sigma B factor antagonist [Geodermatophilus bullaregiensis]
MQFAVDRTAVHGRPALSVRGELDIATVPQLAECVEAELATSPRALVVDLTETTFLDSSGARQLVRTARRAAEAGAALQVVCPRRNTPVRLVIDLLELDRLVPVVEQAGRADGEVGS